MQYQKLLSLAVAPTIVFFSLSLVSVALTVHSWILGDYIIPKWVKVTTNNFDDRLQRYKTDDTIVYFNTKVTDATIASGCLCLTAAVVSFIAWSTLRRPELDSQFSAGKRRFWVLSVIVTCSAGAFAALASIVLHYTEKGTNQYGCDSETLMMAGSMNTNQYCTREMAACNFQPKYLEPKDHGNASLACNEAVTVKWLQIILIINAVIVFVVFSVQARVRRTTRDSRIMEPIPKEEP